MRNLWRSGLSVIIIIFVVGCAHKPVAEHTMVAPPDNTPHRGSKLYEVTVKQVLIDYRGGTNPIPVIILANKENDKQILPIWVGMSEGMSIDTAMKKLMPPRPGTHDLFVSVLGQFRMKMLRAVITDVFENTYVATITMESHGETKEIDARPSDAIALALRCVAPIFISEEVIYKSGWLKVPQQDEKQTKTRKENGLL